MTRILDYDIPKQKYFSIKLPIGARILSVGEGGDKGNGKLYALINIDEERTIRNFRVAKTGMTDMIEEKPKKLDYIGKFNLEGETFHVFEIK